MSPSEKDKQFKNLNVRLQSLLKQHGLTRSRCAEYVGIQRQTVNKLLSGELKMSSDLFTIADYFKVNVDWLARGKGNKFKK